MSEIIRMQSVEPVLFGVVKIVWLTGSKRSSTSGP